MRNLETSFELPNIIGVAGDWHGNTGWALKTIRKFHDQGVTHVVQLGDFGIWGGADAAVFVRKVQRDLAKFNMMLYVIPGNHEDYVRIDSCPVDSETGMQHYSDNIRLMPRGYRMSVSGRQVLFLGGANSIDREWRTPFISWWEGEQITLGDVYRSVEGGKADVMFCHDAPLGVAIPHDLPNSAWTGYGLNYARESQERIRSVVDVVQPQVLFHGHHHSFHDTVVEFNSGTDIYSTRVVGLDMDDKPSSNAIFNFNDLTLELI